MLVQICCCFFLFFVAIVIFFQQSALLGGVTGVIAMSWVSLNAQLSIASGALKFAPKMTSVSECTYEFDHSISLANSTVVLEE